MLAVVHQVCFCEITPDLFTKLRRFIEASHFLIHKSICATALDTPGNSHLTLFPGICECSTDLSCLLRRTDPRDRSLFHVHIVHHMCDSSAGRDL